MCTASFLTHPGGLRVIVNRDEKRTRSAALAPCVHETAGIRAMYPLDPDGGGTWVAVNEAGLVAVLLNKTDAATPTTKEGTAAAPQRWSTTTTSRGRIALALMGCRDLVLAVDRASALDVRHYLPFRLAVVQPRCADVIVLFESDGATLRQTSERLSVPRVIASSSLGDDRVEPFRRMLFTELLASSPSHQLDAQMTFHHSECPERPFAGVVMSRADARTVSRTIVDVDDRAATMRYEALADNCVALQDRCAC